MRQIEMDSIEGFVLAGGASSRMGTDKARLVLGGETFIERIAGALQAVASPVMIVGSRREGENDRVRLNGNLLPVIPDVFEKWGALGGLHAALSAARTEWAVVVACDLPLVTSDLFLHLAGLRADYDAVAPVQEDGRPQPLCAFYRVEACRPATEKLIKAGERRPVTLLQSVHTRWVAFGELADLNGASQFFENVNTPDDYARAQRKAGGSLVL
jgi:molybdenum cofactor guanylyltransferase